MTGECDTVGGEGCKGDGADVLIDLVVEGPAVEGCGVGKWEGAPVDDEESGST